jgi:hypothetical protein
MKSLSQITLTDHPGEPGLSNIAKKLIDLWRLIISAECDRHWRCSGTQR